MYPSSDFTNNLKQRTLCSCLRPILSATPAITSWNAAATYMTLALPGQGNYLLQFQSSYNEGVTTFGLYDAANVLLAHCVTSNRVSSLSHVYYAAAATTVSIKIISASEQTLSASPIFFQAILL
jgi:hypothetical protein